MRSSTVFAAALLLLLFSGSLEADEQQTGSEAAYATAKMIDARIDRQLAKASLEPAPRASKEALQRRLSLDLCGIVPGEKSLGKANIRAVVEKYLSSSRFNEHWSNVLTRSWVGRRREANAQVFRSWLSKELAAKRSYKGIVEDILKAMPRRRVLEKGNAAAYFSLRWGFKAEEVAAQASRVFLGVQIQCAQCHDHPFSEWKQEQFHGFAAYFTEGAYAYKLKGSARPKLFEPKFLFEFEKAVRPSSHRGQVSELLTHKENPYFAKMAVNRVWKELFGRGLVDPIEDLEASEGYHPLLLSFLAEDFVAHDYDLRHLIRSIVSSRAYQRDSKRPESQKDPCLELAEALKKGVNADAARLRVQQEAWLFARFSVRPLSPEQIVDSLLRVTGREALQYKGSKKAIKANTRRFNFLKSRLQDQYESLYEEVENLDPDVFHGSIPQMLIMLNGRFVNEAIEAEEQTFMREVIRSGSPRSMVKRLFRASLFRSPDKQELARYSKLLKDRGTRLEVCEDLLWALMNSAEFLMNH